MKQMLLNLLFFFIIFGISGNARAGLSQQQRLDDATALINLYKYRYAPLPLKKELWNYSLEESAEQLLYLAESAASDLEFYDALIHFTASFKDAHVSSSIPSNFYAYLGFSVQDYNGTVLIVGVNRDILPEERFPFTNGDQLVAIGGQPVDDIIRELSVYFEKGSPKATRRRASKHLTFRPQWKMPYIPKGETTALIYSQKKQRDIEIPLSWFTVGNELAEYNPRESKIGQSISLFSEESQHLNYLEDFDPRSDVYSFGKIKPHYPLWETFLKRNSAPYLTGTISMGGHTIGYIRFHTWYHPPDQWPEIMNFLASEIIFMEENTEALIIDQTSNNGGSTCQGEQAAGFFVKDQTPGMQLAFKPTRKRINMLESILSENDFSEEKVKEYEKKIHDLRVALEEGRDFADPSPFCSTDGIMPVELTDGRIATYTKPKLLLVDELACSCGDAFPAMLQDAGTVTIFGDRTVGCGGSVVDIEYLMQSDLETRVTESLMLRAKPITLPDGSQTRYIENIGVYPDITYEESAEDYFDNYKNYKQAIQESVLKLLRE